MSWLDVATVEGGTASAPPSARPSGGGWLDSATVEGGGALPAGKFSGIADDFATPAAAPRPANAPRTQEGLMLSSPFGVTPYAGRKAPDTVSAPPMSLDQMESAILSKLPASIERGYRSTKGGIAGIEGDIGITSPLEAAREIAIQERRKEEIAQPPELQAAFQKLQEAEGVSDWLGTLYDNPGILGTVMGESAGAFAPAMAAMLLPGKKVKALGAGITGGTSLGVSYNEKVMETFRDVGVDPTNSRQLAAALQDPNVMSLARERGLKYGIPVAIFDTLSAGLGGKLMRGAEGPLSAAVRGTGEMAMQSGLGMAGEASGQLVEKGKVESWSDVGLEGIAELPTGVVETAYGTAAERQKAKAGKKKADDEELDLVSEEDLMDNRATPPSPGGIAVAPPVPSSATAPPRLALPAPGGISPPSDVFAVTPSGTAVRMPQDMAQRADAERTRLRDIGLTPDVVRANAIREGVLPPLPATPSKPARIESPADLDQARTVAASSPFNPLPEPTEGQKEAGNYRKAHVNVQGFPIAIETPKGGERKGVSPTGEPWSVTMPVDYGYIKGTKGADGDHVDVFIGSNPKAETAYVIDQIDTDTGKFDEHKTVLGAKNEAEARQIYESAFSDGKGADRIGSVVEMPIKDFREWVKSPDTKKPTLVQPEDRMAALEREYDTPSTSAARKQAIVTEMDKLAEKRTKQLRQQRDRSRPPSKKKPVELLDFLASIGGIKDETGELASMDLHLWHKKRPFQKRLVRDDGLSYDYAREAAEEAGYGPFDDTVEFLAVIDDSSRDIPRYTMADVEGPETEIDPGYEEHEMHRHYLARAEDLGIEVEGREMADIIDDVHEREAIQDVESVVADQLADQQEQDLDAFFYEDYPEIAELIENSGFSAPEEVKSRYDDTSTETQEQPGAVQTPEGSRQEAEDSERAEGTDETGERPASYDTPAPQSAQESVAPPTIEKTDQGDQVVIPGAERISDRELAERKMSGRKKGSKPQKDADEGLFDIGARKQDDLFAAPTTKKQWDDLVQTGEIKNLSQEQLADTYQSLTKAGVFNKPVGKEIAAEESELRPEMFEGDVRMNLLKMSPYELQQVAFHAGIALTPKLRGNRLKLVERLEGLPARELREAFEEAAPAEGVLGLKLKTGQTATTVTGRVTSPFPKLRWGRLTNATFKAVDQWLMYEAVKEAKSRGDEYNAQLFEHNRERPSQSDKDSAEMYLFGDKDMQPAVVPSILKPLISDTPKAPTDAEIKAMLDQSEIAQRGREQYKGWKEPAPTDDTPIPLTKRGDFYYVTGDDAIRVANALVQAYTTRNGQPETAIPQHTLEEDMKELKRRGITVEVQGAPAKAKEAPAATTAPSGTYTLAEHKEVSEGLDTGAYTAEEVRALLDRMTESKESLKEELGKLTKDELIRQYGIYDRGQKKESLVASAYDNITRELLYSDTFSYMLGQETSEQALKRQINEQTDEDIKKGVERRQKANAASKEYVENYAKAVKNPETLEDFRIFVRENGRAALTDEMLETYDGLVAQEALKLRKEEQARKATVAGVDVPTDVSGDIIETKHTKKGHDLFVVKLSDRVEKEVYQELNKTAKRLGGYYSSFRGQGAIPGFQFTTRKAAEDFTAAMKGETVTAERGRPPETRAEKLRNQGQKIIDAAEEKMNQDRKVNTARRARMAAGAEADAAAEIAMGKTMLAIAAKIEDGTAGVLETINARTEIALLNSLMRRAMYETNRTKKDLSYDERRKLEEREWSNEDAKNITYPHPKFYVEDTPRTAAELEKRPGYKMLAQHLMKRANEARKAGESLFTVTDPKYIAKIKSAAEKYKGTMSWIAEDGVKDYLRAQRMGLTNMPLLREAVRQYAKLVSKAPKADPIREAERALIGAKIEGYFPTPPALAERMAIELDVSPDHRVLEPSAGKGSLIEAVLQEGATPEKVDALEVSSSLRDLLKKKGFNVVGNNFMDHEGEYDRIIMNPPFEKGQDIEHVMHAYEMLAPDGKLVAIMSEGPFFRGDSKATAFREWLDSVGGVSEKLPEGSFKDSDRSTGVATRIVTISKEDAPRPKYSRRAQTKTDSFKEWFGDSKVVDANGEPLVVYHGSPDARFMEDDATFMSLKDRFGDKQGVGVFWFSKDQATAKSYADDRRALDYQGAEPAVIPAYLKLTNPLIVDGGGKQWREAQARGKTRDVIDEAAAGGYDGIIIRNVRDNYNNTPSTRPTDTYAVFNSRQIKSATGNRGTFDPNDPRVTYSRRNDGKPFYSALSRSIEELKQPKATTAQWKGIISNLPQKGVKQEEIDWSGVNEWLDGQEGPVTKDAVLEYLSTEGSVDLREVVQSDVDYKVVKSSPNLWQLQDTETGEKFGRYRSEEEAIDDTTAAAERRNKKPTKYSEYTLPGGRKYREMLLTLPEEDRSGKVAEYNERMAKANSEERYQDYLDLMAERDKYIEETRNKSFKSPHYDEPNILATVRFNEREDNDGNRVLFVEEIQSDWHQQGRKKGYSQSQVPFEQWQKENGTGDISDDRRRYNLYLEMGDPVTGMQAVQTGVPDAPFKKTWHELAMKRVLRYAAENGFDKVAWTTGEQQNERYDLSKQVRMVTYNERTGDFHAWKIDNDSRSIEDADISEKGVTPEKLTDIIGKDAAKKLMDKDAQPFGGRVLEGSDLKVGGAGMVGFYDKILPAFVNKYAKKWGAKVSPAALDVGEYRVEKDYNATGPQYRLRQADSSTILSRHETSSEAWAEAERLGSVQVHSIDITPEMRESVMQGQPLFQRRATASTDEKPSVKIARDLYASPAKGLTKDERQIANMMARELKRLAPKVKRKLYRSLAEKRYGIPDVDGAFFENSTKRRAVPIIALALDAADPLGTPRHEVIHYLRAFGLITPEEWSVLSAKAKSENWIKRHKVLKTWPELRGDKDAQIEEAVAEEFRLWRRDKDNLGYPPLMKRAFNKFDLLLRRIRAGIRKIMGRTPDVSDIFSAVESGKKGRQKPSAEIIRFKTSRGVRYSKKAQRKALRDARLEEGGNALKRWAKRNFTAEGLLNKEAFARKVSMEGIKNADELDIEAMVFDFEKEVSKAYKKPYDKLTDDQKRSIKDYLAGDKSAKIPRSLHPHLAHMRVFLDAASGRMQDAMSDLLNIGLEKLNPKALAEAEKWLTSDGAEGRMPEHLIGLMNTMQTIENNKGSYLHRSYQAFDDPDWKKKALRDKALIARAEAYIADQNPDFTPDEVTGAVRNILQDAYEKGNFVSYVQQGSKVGSKDVSMLKRRKEVPEVIRELLGEYQDPKVAFVKSASKMSNYLAGHYFLTNLYHEGVGTFLFERPTGVFDTRIAAEGSEVMNPLSGLYAMEDFVIGMSDAAGKFEGGAFMQQYLRFNSAVKYGKTILSPTTQFRNFISAAFFTLMNGHFNWLPAAKAFAVTRSDLFTHEQKWRDYIRPLVEMGVLHNNPRSEELREAIRDVTREDYIAGTSTIGNVLKTMQKLYQSGDDFWKIIGYENEKALLIKHRGLSEKEASLKAAERIRNGYPTYSLVPRGIKTLRRWPLVGAFVSFPWEIIRTTKNQFSYMMEDARESTKGTELLLARRITGMGLAMGAAYATSQASMMLLGIDDDDDEAVREMGPPWQENALLAYMGYDKDGLPIYLDLSHLDPYSYLKKPISALMNENYDTAGKKARAAIIEMGSPFLGPDIAASAIGEVVYNKKLGGGQVYNPEETNWKIGLDILKHLKQLAPGVVTNIERTALAAAGGRTRAGREYSLRDEALAWVGFRLTTLNIPQSLIYKGYEFNDAIRASSSILNYTAGAGNEVSEAELEDAFYRMIEARDRAYRNIQKQVEAAKALGVPSNEIGPVLGAAGVSKKNIYAIMRGKIPAWEPSDMFLNKAEERAFYSTPSDKDRKQMRQEMNKRRRLIQKLARENFLATRKKENPDD